MLHWMKVWLRAAVNEKQIELFIACFFKFIRLSGRKVSNKVVCLGAFICFVSSNSPLAKHCQPIRHFNSSNNVGIL